MELLDPSLRHFNFWIYVVLMMIGLYAMISKNNLIKKLIGMSIFQTAIILFFVSLGVKDDATIPIYEDMGHADVSETTTDPHHAEPESEEPGKETVDRMEGLSKEKRAARFMCSVALASPAGSVETFLATCEGRIATEPSGAGGFGYDPIFYLEEIGCCMADLTAEEKHRISHRGKVLRLVTEHLAASG